MKLALETECQSNNVPERIILKRFSLKKSVDYNKSMENWNWVFYKK